MKAFETHFVVGIPAGKTSPAMRSCVITKSTLADAFAIALRRAKMAITPVENRG